MKVNGPPLSPNGADRFLEGMALSLDIGQNKKLPDEIYSIDFIGQFLVIILHYSRHFYHDNASKCHGKLVGGL